MNDAEVDEWPTDALHCFAEGDVVGNDLGQFGKMPAVPFFASHDVVVRFFVEIVQESYDSGGVPWQWNEPRTNVQIA